MLNLIELSNSSDVKSISTKIKRLWKSSKVIHLKVTHKDYTSNPQLLREFYDNLISELGVSVELGEDINLGDRESQRSGEKWMEIRYDPTIKDAYRYSSNPQPLHTDGSYIPSFPNASLIYC